LPSTSSQRKGKRLNFLLHVAVNQATDNIAVVNIATTIEATNATAMIDNLTTIIKTIGATIALDAMTRMRGATSPTTRRMIASAITSRKGATRPCIMTSPLCQAPAICPEEGGNLIPDHLRALSLALGLALVLAQAAGATTIIMLTKMTASQVQHPSKGIHSSMGTCTPPRVTTADAFIAQIKTILSLPPSPLQRQRRSTPRNRESRQ
jgi:hypothetical protein